jgi:cell wall-associated NlpC family hydrolase
VSDIPQPITRDFSKLLGVPYSTKDCWGIVVDFYRIVFDIELNRYYQEIPKTRDASKALVYSSMGDFHKVEDRKFGDIFLIKLYGVECHIAVYIDNGMMLHTTNHSGCVVDRVHRWEKLIVGTYRVVGEK